MPVATVLIATHDHGPMLLRSVGSVLAQSMGDLEVLIAGDGATAETRESAMELSADSRVRFLDFPKAPWTGGENRHRALLEARGEIVCYLDDDDLWAPDHVETMQRLLAEADCAHTLPIAVDAQGSLLWGAIDLRVDHHRELLLLGRTGVAKSFFAHRLETYRRLTDGWRGLPGGQVVVDLWQQLLLHPGCRLATSRRPTGLQFPKSWRVGWSLDRRLAELDAWRPRLAGTEWPQLVLDAVVGCAIGLQLHLDELREWHRQGEAYAASLADTLAATQDSLAAATRYATSLEAERARLTAENGEVERYAISLRAALEAQAHRAETAEAQARDLERALASTTKGKP